MLSGRVGTLFTHPAEPILITGEYVDTQTLRLDPETGNEAGEKALIEYNLAFETDRLLVPVRGMELLSIRSIDPERSTGSRRVWAFTVVDDRYVEGERKH